MLTRAMIVLLIVLNLGVAAWWALRPPPAEVVTPPPTAPALRLLREGGASAHTEAVAPVVAPASQSAATAPVAAVRCMTFGPFSDATVLAQASGWLQPRVSKLRVRKVSTGGRGWRVWLPPLADRGAAQAMAARIAAAGFNDYYIVPGGDEANGIALGRYGSEQPARQHALALQAAGFAAQAQALGTPVSWIDVEATTLDSAVARMRTKAPSTHPLDCTKPD